MPRATWSGSITFGLVTLPVKAYSAVRCTGIDFDLLRAEDNARIEYRRVCPVDGEVVAWEDIVKGYEIEPGRYVTFSQEELEQLRPEATKTIDIEDFVRLDLRSRDARKTQHIERSCTILSRASPQVD
jgi:DNA end-binding protein Ku